MKRHKKLAEIDAICAKYGWAREYDNCGQIVLYTDLITDDGETLRNLEEKDLLENE